MLARPEHPRIQVGRNDLNDAIVVGARRREPATEFSRLRDLGLATRSDPEVLEFAAQESWILVSHDVNTMREVACIRLDAGLSIGGLLLIHQRTGVSSIIESLLLIWAASEAEEWDSSATTTSAACTRTRGSANRFCGKKPKDMHASRVQLNLVHWQGFFSIDAYPRGVCFNPSRVLVFQHGERSGPPSPSQ
jgi:hypothetical protein